MITAGSVTQFFLFDVAHSINLPEVQAALGPGATTARLSFKNAGVPRIKYEQAPLVAAGEIFGQSAVGDFKVRIKLFDYGVISVMLTRPFSGSWSGLIEIAHQLIGSDEMERRATTVCRSVVARLGPALEALRDSVLTEDYLVLAAYGFETPQSAASLVERHGPQIAQALRGERSPLGGQEVEEVLRHRLSYFDTDLIVPAWNAAFVYDTEADAAAANEIFEFANSQLLEFRFYDQLLERELQRTYAELQSARWTDRLLGRRHTRATRRLHTLFIDVNELTDHMENAVKVVGDVYGARLVSSVATRVGVPDWKANVRDKLETLDDIHRFAVEQTTGSRATLLEATVVLILIIELVLLLAGLGS